MSLAITACRVVGVNMTLVCSLNGWMLSLLRLLLHHARPFYAQPSHLLSGTDGLYSCVMQAPPGFNGPTLPGFSITPPAVLIFGNGQLYNVSALAKLGRCSSNPTATADPIFIEVRRQMRLQPEIFKF